MSNKTIINRNVIFDEDAKWDWTGSDKSSIQVPLEEVDDLFADIRASTSSNESCSPINSTPSTPSKDISIQATPRSTTEASSTSYDSSSTEATPRKVRSLKNIYETCSFALNISDPITYEEAAKEEVWREAMKDELAAIEKNNTWKLVTLPEGKTTVGLKWIYKTKVNADGSIQRHKARLVAKGYSQLYGVDYNETYSPVARMETVRAFIALAAYRRWKVYQLDIKSAFLNGELKEDVYVDQPEGFSVTGNEDKVYKLHKALYGLKQAPRVWYSRIDSYFLQNGFERSPNEHTLYVKKQSEDEVLLVCLYVDDIIYTGSSQTLVDEFRSDMKKVFEMSDLGKLQYFLGLEVVQTGTGIFVSQQKFANDLLKRFNMNGCREASTPVNANEKLQVNDSSGNADGQRYRSLIGGLLYLSHTRPDIMFAVGLTSRFMNKPTKHHLGAAKRILRYIAGTFNYGLWYEASNESKLQGFTDSD